ncbi:MAG: hypothetical protein JW718_07570 [Desulfovibrionaceae bacterium]|nr:hypothetical protein [Desulfovibrionaceae bacterium]
MLHEFLTQRLDFIHFAHGLGLFFIAAFTGNMFRRGRQLHWLWLCLSSLSLALSLALVLAGKAFTGIQDLPALAVSLHALALFFLALFGSQGLPSGRPRSSGYVLSGIFLILPAAAAVFYGVPGFAFSELAGLGLVSGLLCLAGIWMLVRRKADSPPLSGPFYPLLALYAASVTILPGTYAAILVSGQGLAALAPSTASEAFAVLSAALAMAVAVVLARTTAFGQDGPERHRKQKIFAFALGLSAVGVSIFLGFTFTDSLGDNAERSIRNELFMRVAAVGNALDPEEVRMLSGEPGDTDSPSYKRLLRQLNKIRLSNKDIRFVYLVGMRPADRNVVFILDTEPPTSEDYACPGLVYDEAPEGLKAIFSSGKTDLVGPYTDRWGFWVSGFAPVRDEFGAILGVVGMDINAHSLKAIVAANRLMGITITFLLAVIGAGVGLLIERNSELNLAISQLRQEVNCRVRAETDLKEARDTAEEASRAKGDFLASMSHEIRTPINTIVGMTEIAMREASSPEQRTHMEAVKVAADHLMSLVSDILDLSKIEAGKLDLSFESFDLPAAIESAGLILKAQARAKGLSLSMDIDPTLPERAESDPRRLRQVIINLLGNAIKFTESGGVSLKASSPGPNEYPDLGMTPGKDGFLLLVSIQDTGIGIPPDKT